MRAAIYARFSSDLQSDRSIADQTALCRTVCDRAGFTLVATYEDRALSGASTGARAGFQAMMQAAARREFDVVVAEDVDRISRDQADWHLARKRLTHYGVKIHTPGGVVGSLDGSVRAMMAEHFLENLSQHVHRGLAGVVRSGRSAGGRAYGYRPILGRPGELEIVEGEAAVICRIYQAYVAGDMPRAIAQALNAESVQPPRGNYWRASTLMGNPQRGHGILMNEIYRGRIVWNRVKMIRDPDTGKRLSRPNAPSDYQRADAPHLRIVDDELFEAAQARREKRTHAGKRGRRKPRHALSGLLRCGCCGSGMSIKDRDRGRLRIICSQKKEAGTCANGRSYYLDRIEACVVETLKAKIGSRDAIAYYIRVFNEERRLASSEAIANRSRIEARLAEAQRGLDRMIDAVAAGTLTTDEVGERIPKLRTARDQAKAELAAIGEPAKVVSLHPTAIKDYLQNLDRLAELIGADLAAGDDGLAQALRALVDTVTIMPAPAGEAPEVRIAGHLESLMKLDAFPARSFAGGQVVAREGLEPPTPGL
jgi:site-specific DNA recombinase